ncbi:DNA-methyltransferase [Chryseobacterium sediminis]|uniref:Methyltransferase n=1 Tax=Chryseobacterium sediminis TaxID=1679494 RepID=A0A5B2U943_9FLAO|nr:DNA methyltransferase [Chryseobacterium sediminis]KAA2223059.1 site-specific DNA-methyltransferase [Chryseobacterium sediminis]
MKNIQLYNEDNLELMKRLPDESIDVICIDPPYLYLKNQKLERPFDEHKFFSECARLLTKNGFIVMFGRGESFYRWNTLLENIRKYKNEYVIVDKKITAVNNAYIDIVLSYNGIDVTNDKSFKKVFNFKEEIVWDKSQNSIPAAPILRIHELVNIYTKGSGKLNNVKIPYLEAKKHNIDGVIQDVKRIKSAINSKEFEDIEHFLNTGEIIYTEKKSKNHMKNAFHDRSRGLATLRTIQNGMKEKTIIRELRDHYNTIHPTQKPVSLLVRLLALVIPESKPHNEIVIADFFGGSMSCMEAVHNMGMKGIACEIDQEYFELGKARIENLIPVQEELFKREVV